MSDADRFRLEAKECSSLADKARKRADKEAWLELAADWIKLAEEREWDRKRYGD
jgi:hypothetical protein